MKFNVKNQQKFVFKPAPKGLYPAVVESLEQSESTKGNQQLVWTFVLDTDDEFNGRKLKVWTVLPDEDNPEHTEQKIQFFQNNLNRYLFGFASQLGIEIPDPNVVADDEELENLVEDEKNTLTLDDIVERIEGEHCYVNLDVVKHYQNKGEFQNSVLGTLPIDTDE